jgi:hypothetical protein
MKCPRASVVAVTVSDGELIRKRTPGIGKPVAASVIVPEMPPLVPASAQAPWLKKATSNPHVPNERRNNDDFMYGVPPAENLLCSLRHFAGGLGFGVTIFFGAEGRCGAPLRWYVATREAIRR